MSIGRLFTPRGRIDRAPFLALGLLLVAAKLALDAMFCRLVFHHPWQIAGYYWSQAAILRGDRQSTPLFIGTMLTVAAPFAWIGVCLTTQRLRAVRAPLWLVVLFFAPLLKFVLFVLLSILPSQPEPEPPLPNAQAAPASGLSRWLPDSFLGSAIAAALCGAVLVTFSVRWQQTYFIGLFVGTPFLIGFIAAVLYGARAPRRIQEAVGVALVALLASGIALVALGVDGLICILMAAPLALCEAVAGAFVAHAFGDALHRRRLHSSLSLMALMPLLMMLERDQPPPSLLSVTSEIVVDAPPAEVWPHVIRFGQIPPPRDWIFRAGIAYPVCAVIDGHGVGATRHCDFSTGEFVEPITIWDEPARLAFTVAAQPDPLQELSPYRALQPPHLRGYFRSERGEFRLLALPNDRTLLRGTTWYRDRLKPQAYWRLWSNLFIHRIHLRVLEHIRAEVILTRSDPR